MGKQIYFTEDEISLIIGFITANFGSETEEDIKLIRSIENKIYGSK